MSASIALAPQESEDVSRERQSFALFAKKMPPVTVFSRWPARRRMAWSRILNQARRRLKASVPNFGDLVEKTVRAPADNFGLPDSARIMAGKLRTRTLSIDHQTA
jgi:hypothetical protein